MCAAVTKFEEGRSKGLKLFVVVQKIFDRHENDVICMRTKFHLHECYHFRSKEVNAWLLFEIFYGRHGNDVIRIRTKLHIRAC